MKRKILFFFLCVNICNAQEIPPKRAHHALVYDEKQNTILMTGGSTPIDGGKSYLVFNDLWKFDGNKWVKTGNAGDERSGMGLAFDEKQKQIASFGGFANNKPLEELRLLVNNEWKTITALPEMKLTEPGFVYNTNNGKYYVFGGSGIGGVKGTFWEYDGKSWKIVEGTNPPARQAFAMVYDKKRNRIVLFGGMGETPEAKYGDTWEYDFNRWVKVAENGPEARVAFGYVYDSKKGQLLIFGGLGKGVLGDTWEWDGKAWQKLSDSGPKPRMMGYMAYDEKRNKTVLFGGRLGWPNDANDTWEWNGKEWQEIK